MIAEEDNQQEGEMTGRGGESVCGCVLQTEKSRPIKGIQSASIPLVTLIRMLPNVSIRKINIICTCCHLKKQMDGKKATVWTNRRNELWITQSIYEAHYCKSSV